MTNGTNVRDEITDFITRNGSSVTIQAVTKTEGDYGGYEGVTKTEGDSSSELGIPSRNLLKPKGEAFGRIRSADLTIVLRYSADVAEDYIVTFREIEYKIIEIKEIVYKDVVIAQRVTLSRLINVGD